MKNDPRGSVGEIREDAVKILDESGRECPPAMLDESGTIIVSVPTMVGIPFLIQRLALAATGSIREPLSWRELLRAGVLRDTTSLEAKWDGDHLGFNHLRLEQALRTRFRIARRSNLGFQMMYEVARS